MARVANMIVNTIQIEMKGRTCVIISAEKAKSFVNIALFGNFVEDHFPSASPEISEAGKCFALARYSATVFHLMRVLEIRPKVPCGCHRRLIQQSKLAKRYRSG